MKGNCLRTYLYGPEDKKTPGMRQYVYFFTVDYEKSKNKNENEVFKRVELNGVSKDLYGGYNPFGMQQRMDMNNGNYVVPEGVTTIGDDCFNKCSLLKDIIIPDSVLKIGSKVIDDDISYIYYTNSFLC